MSSVSQNIRVNFQIKGGIVAVVAKNQNFDLLWLIKISITGKH